MKKSLKLSLIVIPLLIVLGLLIVYLKNEIEKNDPSYACELILKQQIPAQPPDSIIRFELWNELPYITAAVNGSAPLPFIFATSMGVCSYDQELADIQKLTDGSTNLNYTSYSGRNLPLKLGQFDSLQLGQCLGKNIPVFLNNLDWTFNSFGKYAAGFIGYEFLKNYAVECNFLTGTMKLTKTDTLPCELEESDSLAVLPFIHYPEFPRQVFVKARINQRDMVLVLDTLVPDGLLLAGTPDRYQPGVTFGGFENTARQGRSHTIQRGTVSSLELGGILLTNIPTQFSCVVTPGEEAPLSNVLGMAVLKKLKFVISYPKQVVLFQKY
ncbi:hypothetical protein JW964_15045 [candidate division KSB1 bacterium]|nr:hypothetical protein [candidate division KSB1 bacterium]